MGGPAISCACTIALSTYTADRCRRCWTAHRGPLECPRDGSALPPTRLQYHVVHAVLALCTGSQYDGRRLRRRVHAWPPWATEHNARDATNTPFTLRARSGLHVRYNVRGGDGCARLLCKVRKAAAVHCGHVFFPFLRLLAPSQCRLRRANSEWGQRTRHRGDADCQWVVVDVRRTCWDATSLELRKRRPERPIGRTRW